MNSTVPSSECPINASCYCYFGAVVPRGPFEVPRLALGGGALHITILPGGGPSCLPLSCEHTRIYPCGVWAPKSGTEAGQGLSGPRSCRYSLRLFEPETAARKEKALLGSDGNYASPARCCGED